MLGVKPRGRISQHQQNIAKPSEKEDTRGKVARKFQKKVVSPRDIYHRASLQAWSDLKIGLESRRGLKISPGTCFLGFLGILFPRLTTPLPKAAKLVFALLCGDGVYKTQ